MLSALEMEPLFASASASANTPNQFYIRIHIRIRTLSRGLSSNINNIILDCHLNNISASNINNIMRGLSNLYQSTAQAMSFIAPPP